MDNSEEIIKQLKEENEKLKKQISHQENKKKTSKHLVTAKPAILHYKLVVMGSGGVGKSALTIRYVVGAFEENYNPTIEDTYNKDVTVDNHLYHLEILDTAGQSDQFYNVYYRQGQVFMFLYSVASRQSFQHIAELLETLKRVREDDLQQLPILIIGSKCDLEDERVVSSREGQEFAEKHGAKFLETSAKTGRNIEEAFATCIRFADEKIPLPVRPERKSSSWCHIV